MPHQLFRRKNGSLQCALICSLCAFISFVPFLIQNGGFFHVWSDFNWQQIPFGIALHNALDGMNPGGWTWSYDLGMSTIQAFSFYGMGSPFYWISLLFPADWYPYLVGWIYILKYTVAGVAAYSYIRRFTKRDASAVAGALMYAFSGFQAANLMYYHFHDVVALFPLLLTGTEKVLEDPRDRGMLIFAVFINALNNYYFLVMEAVFTGLYFVFRSFGRRDRDLRRTGRDLLNCLLCAGWGAAMAAVLLLPSLLYILRSPRADRATSSADLFWDFRWLLFTIRGQLLPGDTMVHQSAFYSEEYGSVAAWLPMAGMGLSLVYVLKHRWKNTDWLSGMILLLLLVSVSPALSSGFILFLEVTYRWWFMPVLLAALASAKVLDAEEEYPVKKGLAAYFLIVLAFCGTVCVLNAIRQDSGLIRNTGRFLAFSGISLAGILLLLLLGRVRKLNSRILTFLVCLFAAGTTFLTMNCYYHYTGDGTEQRNLEIGMKLEMNNPQYRYDVVNNQIELPGGGSGLTIFSSTLSQGVREFDSLFGYYSKNHTMDKSLVPGLTELFGAAYNIRGVDESVTPVQSFQAGGGSWTVREKDACPIGFAVDHYILREKLLEIDEKDRGVALLYAAVIDPEEEELLSGLCTALPAESILFGENLSAIVAKNRENAVRDFSRDNRGFRCVSEYAAPEYVYFSVPYDRGWTARIDGEKREILPSGGMMLLQVPEGFHEIDFTYITPGYTAGKYISLSATAAYVIFCLIRRIRKRDRISL